MEISESRSCFEAPDNSDMNVARRTGGGLDAASVVAAESVTFSAWTRESPIANGTHSERPNSEQSRQEGAPAETGASPNASSPVEEGVRPQSGTGFLASASSFKRKQPSAGLARRTMWWSREKRSGSMGDLVACGSTPEPGGSRGLAGGSTRGKKAGLSGGQESTGSSACRPSLGSMPTAKGASQRGSRSWRRAFRRFTSSQQSSNKPVANQSVPSLPPKGPMLLSNPPGLGPQGLSSCQSPASTPSVVVWDPPSSRFSASGRFSASRRWDEDGTRLSASERWDAPSSRFSASRRWDEDCSQTSVLSASNVQEQQLLHPCKVMKVGERGGGPGAPLGAEEVGGKGVEPMEVDGVDVVLWDQQPQLQQQQKAHEKLQQQLQQPVQQLQQRQQQQSPSEKKLVPPSPLKALSKGKASLVASINSLTMNSGGTSLVSPSGYNPSSGTPRAPRKAFMGTQKEPRCPLELLLSQRGAMKEHLGRFLLDASRLELGETLASGSSGEVRKGRYAGQEVAIKILEGDGAPSDLPRGTHSSRPHQAPHSGTLLLRAEFRREVLALLSSQQQPGQQACPQLLPLVGVCVDPMQRLCLVTRFMEGGTLYDLLIRARRRQGPAAGGGNHGGAGVGMSGPALPMEQLLAISADVAKAMDFLHAHGILHRDLKSQNVFLDSHGGAVVGDLGVARLKGEGGEMTKEVGTYRWMAPEAFGTSAWPVTPKSDVYSFGVLLWEMVTGEIPFEGYTPLQAAVGVALSGLRPTIPEYCPSQLAGLIQECWDKDPERRPSFASIVGRLQEWQRAL